MKKVFTAVEAGDKATAETMLVKAQKKIAMARSKGIYKANNASRKISQIYTAVNKMQ
jgi:ribosomal protein S20